MNGGARRPLLRRWARRLRSIPHRIGYGPGPRLMSWLRKRWVLLKHPQATIVFEGPVYLGPGFSLHIPGDGTFIVGHGVEFRRNFRAEIANGGTIKIGAGSYLTYDCIITCATSIEIGERCGLGQSLYMTDGNHRYRDLTKPVLAQGYNFRELKIEDDVVIFSKCTVTNSIATRSIIGANSMVTRPIPAYCVAAGVPAKPIDYFGPPGQEPPGFSAPAAQSADTSPD